MDNKHHASDRDQGDVKATGILTREKLQHIIQMRDLMISHIYIESPLRLMTQGAMRCSMMERLQGYCDKKTTISDR
ncbi:hypothetical protein THS27_23640 [Thalassospira sp. MCCC 1A01428]|nr:hypothetical protein THS27_23640 [Thalassospira sp. MCCC 1A01428]